MAKSEGGDTWGLPESPPDSPAHGSDLLGTVSEAAPPPEVEPPAPAPEPEQAPAPLSEEMQVANEQLNALLTTALSNMAQLEADLEQDLKKQLVDFQEKMKQLKHEMVAYVSGAFGASVQIDNGTQAMLDKLQRFNAQLAMCARRGGDAAMQG